MNYLLLFTDVLLKARVHNGASSSQMTRTDRMVKSRLELTRRRVGDNVADLSLLDRGRLACKNNCHFYNNISFLI